MQEVKEGFGNQINLCRDRGFNPGPPEQKSCHLAPRPPGSALYCYNCGSIMSMKGGCDNAANKKLVTLEKCQPNVKRCFNLKTSTDKTVSRGCLTEAVDYYCTGLGYCETCQGDFCNGNTNFHSGLAKLFKFAKEA
uniref:Uncharacterized protein n=1 Tax=Timema genevievae TaxID=629358 RepID=A0A7R9K9I7_TIMGE|nr:unnamed protein product [Timema genevievae]